MIPHDKFPWLSHRTLHEVDETDWLRRKRRIKLLGFNGANQARLQALEARAAEPPPVVA